MHQANPMYRSNRYRYGIDFKNPFTMSNRGAVAPECRRTNAPNLWSSSSGNMLDLVEPIGIEPMT